MVDLTMVPGKFSGAMDKLPPLKLVFSSLLSHG